MTILYTYEVQLLALFGQLGIFGMLLLSLLTASLLPDTVEQEPAAPRRSGEHLSFTHHVDRRRFFESCCVSADCGHYLRYFEVVGGSGCKSGT